jgi:hypothetical protein
MRRLFLLTAAGLWLIAGASLAHGADGKGKSGEDHSCGSFGTKVEFVDTPSEAAKLAKKQEKLVFVLHVSGNFEDPRFT